MATAPVKKIPPSPKEQAIVDAANQKKRDEMEYNLETQAGAPTPERPVNTPKKYAKGGSVSARADGCAQRGKTKGRFV
jgi:hypothetical protein